jgi:YesN/AraC family two-component response regulator
MIRVLLADDQSLVRAGFKALLDARDDIEVIGEAADGAGAVDLARKLRPDVILMDIRMPGLDGLEATRQGSSQASGVSLVNSGTWMPRYALAWKVNHGPFGKIFE